MTPSSTDLSDRSLSWVFGSGSDVHACADISWFDTYTAFASKTMENLGILGVGTVKLKVKTDFEGSLNEITLKDVIHVPSMICNLVGAPIQEEFIVITGPYPDEPIGGEFLDEHTHARKGLLSKYNPLMTLLLSDDTPGKVTLIRGALYQIRVCWGYEERARFQAFKEQQMSGATAKEMEYSGKDPLTLQERAWLKEGKWGDEYNFFVQNGLNIHDEDDRAQGRSMIRGYINEAEKKST
ncbi:hypothetical protein ABW21_db0208569 [Orbilia brochopaga]|nr:hypothetical protein ABW21_db0208569 [Drechslerella brochopaga]